MKIIRYFILCSLSSILTFASICPIFAIAPRTEKIAFTSNRDGNNEIYIMNPDGTEQINLTNHGASDAQPAWSPDGKQILFTSNRNGTPDLYLMDADGTNVRKVFKNLKLRSAPAWSPDGKQISYARNDRLRGLFIASVDGTNEKLIALVGEFDGYSNWSADGTKIVFDAPIKQKGHSRVHIFDLSTRQQEVLLGEDVATVMGAPVWSPSSDKIALAWLKGGSFSIYIIDHDGENPKQIVQPLAGFSTDNPDWSPNGSALVYEQYQIGSSRQIYTVDLKGGEPDQLTRRGLNFFADWFDPKYALPVAPQPHLLTTVWGKMKSQD